MYQLARSHRPVTRAISVQPLAERHNSTSCSIAASMVQPRSRIGQRNGVLHYNTRHIPAPSSYWSWKNDSLRITGQAMRSTPDYDRWVKQLEAFAGQVADLSPEIHEHLRDMLRHLCDPCVTLTFGGHFSSGKSTIINALLGRHLLPVGDLPETGIMCALRAGQCDAAEMVSGSHRRPIDCTAAAIQREVALISQTGERRTAVQQIDQIAITLNSGAIPPHTVWIDSPGINDTREMNERARHAARQADILLWVLSSYQPLSETEMAFLAQHIAECGPASVILLLNIFLPQDTPQEWENFLTHKLTVYQNKIKTFAPLIGCKSQIPPLIVISGRALYTQNALSPSNTTRSESPANHDSFGAQSLYHLIRSLSTADCPHIRKARLQRAAIALRQLIPMIEQRMARDQARREEVQATWQKQRQEATYRQARFKQAIESIVDLFLAEWSTYARACAVTLASHLTAAAPTSCDSYARQLDQWLKIGASYARSALLLRLAAAVQQFDQLPLRNTSIVELQHMLTPPDIVVPESRHSRRAGKATGPADPSTPLTRLVKSIIKNTVVGAQQAYSVERMPEAIQSATEQAIAALQRKRAEVVAFIIAHTTVPSSTALDLQPDDVALRRTEALLRWLLHLAEEADDLCRHTTR
jgi:predicted GTPase